MKENPLSFSQLLNHFAIATGKLNYHLKLLEGFISKTETGLYQNTPFGNRTLHLLQEFHDNITDNDRPLLKKAYVSQIREKRTFLHLRIVGGLYAKIIALLIAIIMIVITTILYYKEGVDVTTLWPIYVIGGTFFVIGIIWVYRMYKPATEFVDRVNQLLYNPD